MGSNLAWLLAICVLAASTLATGLDAQVTPSQAAVASSSALLQPDVFSQAKGLAVAGNVNAAEAVLVAQVRTPARTLAWYVECSRYLTRLTISLGADRRIDAQRAVAMRALGYLAGAEGTTTHAATLSNLRTTEGMLQERFLEDPAAANASYQRALSASASNNVAASALARLKAIDEDKSARLGRKPAGG